MSGPADGGRHHHDDPAPARWTAPDQTGEWVRPSASDSGVHDFGPPPVGRRRRREYDAEIAGHDDRPPYEDRPAYEDRPVARRSDRHETVDDRLNFDPFEDPPREGYEPRPAPDRFDDRPSRDRFDTTAPFDRITEPPAYEPRRHAPVEERPAFGRHHEPRAEPAGPRHEPAGPRHEPAGPRYEAGRPRHEPAGPRYEPGGARSEPEPGGGRRRRADDTGEYGGRRRAPDGTDTGQWERMTDTGQYVRTTTTGDWDRLTDTGSHPTPAPRRDWDRMTDTGAHERAIAWDRLTDTGSHSIADDRAEERFEAFWSGHRLAGDDPRWVATPSSAPRSPAISYPERRRVDEPVPRPRAPRPAGRAAAPARRPVTAPPRRRPEPLQDLETEQTNVLTVLFYTAIWYAVPVLVFGAWLLTLDNSAPAGCVSDITGGGCESARAHAFASLLGGVRLFGIALGASLVLAIFMRWLGRGWRAGSIALAAAVVGGGLSTVALSALNGQPIG